MVSVQAASCAEAAGLITSVYPAPRTRLADTPVQPPLSGQWAPPAATAKTAFSTTAVRVCAATLRKHVPRRTQRQCAPDMVAVPMSEAREHPSTTVRRVRCIVVLSVCVTAITAAAIAAQTLRQQPAESESGRKCVR